MDLSKFQLQNIWESSTTLHMPCASQISKIARSSKASQQHVDIRNSSREIWRKSNIFKMLFLKFTLIHFRQDLSYQTMKQKTWQGCKKCSPENGNSSSCKQRHNQRLPFDPSICHQFLNKYSSILNIIQS